MRLVTTVAMIGLIGGYWPLLTQASVPRPLPTPRVAAPEAAPKILAVRLSSTRVHIGDTWSGTILTTTNVASLEVSSPSFVFSAKRVAFGKFTFTLHWLFIEPLYRRQYTVAFVARNAAGVIAERDMTVDFR